MDIGKRKFRRGIENPVLPVARIMPRVVDGNTQRAATGGFRALDQGLGSAAIVLNVQLKPDWASRCLRHFFDAAVGNGADDQRRPSRASSSHGGHLAVRMCQHVR